jgi:hypothetical protein
LSPQLGHRGGWHGRGVGAAGLARYFQRCAADGDDDRQSDGSRPLQCQDCQKAGSKPALAHLPAETGLALGQAMPGIARGGVPTASRSSAPIFFCVGANEQEVRMPLESRKTGLMSKGPLLAWSR